MFYVFTTEVPNDFTREMANENVKLRNPEKAKEEL